MVATILMALPVEGSSTAQQIPYLEENKILLRGVTLITKNSSGTEGEPSQKREKNGNRTRDLLITDQMDVLTNQVHLKIQFRHRFDEKINSQFVFTRRQKSVFSRGRFSLLGFSLG